MAQYTTTTPVKALQGAVVITDDVVDPNFKVSSTGVLGNDIKIGNRNPNFRLFLNTKKDASSYYKIVEHRIEQHPLFCSTSVNPTTYNTRELYYLNNLALLSSPPAVFTSADDRALKKLKGKLARDLDEFKSLVPLGEIKETRGLVQSTAKVTEDFLKSVLELKRGRPRKFLSSVSKAWLQWSFAISPTVSDTQQLLSSISSHLNRQDFIGRYYGSHSIKWKSQLHPATPNVVAALGGFWNFGPWQAEHSYDVQFTAGVKFDLLSSNDYSAADKFGVGTIGEFVPLVWELTAFSWIGDYFTTMGDFLSDTFSAKGGNTFYCTKSAKYKCVAQCDAVYAPQFTFTRLNEKHNQPQFYYNTNFERSVLAQIPHRTMRFKTLDEIGINGVNRLFNLSSILLSGLK